MVVLRLGIVILRYALSKNASVWLVVVVLIVVSVPVGVAVGQKLLLRKMDKFVLYL